MERPALSLTRDTICALSTAPLTAAIGVVRLSGPQALKIASKVFRCKQLPDLTQSKAYGCYYGNVVLPFEGDKVLDQCLCTVFLAPKSYTGEDSVEFSCHGSLYILNTLLQALCRCGARAARAGEFSERAFLNGKMDLTQIEAVADVIASDNAAAHSLAMNQLRGGVSQQLSAIREQLLHLASLMELELDFAEEDVSFADKTHLCALLDALEAHTRRLCESFRLGNVIKNGVPVALVGAVNAGKSTLLNALLGEERAIVSSEEGTTRDTVEDTLVIHGICFRFIDTAGLRQTDSEVENLGIARSYEKIRSASVLILLLDPHRPETVRESIAQVVARKSPEMQDLLVVFNKTEQWVSAPFVLEDEERMARDFAGYLAEETAARQLTVAPPLRDLMGRAVAQLLDSGVPVRSLSCVSAKQGRGIQTIKDLLSEAVTPRIEEQGHVLLTNVRHYQALSQALTALDRVREGLAAGLSTELLTQDLREVLFHIGSITGEISTEEILGSIFGRFCIGK